MSYSYRIPNASGGCKTPGRLNRSSWGPMTGTSIHRPDPPGTPEDYAELYQEHVLSTQNRQLYPLQEDLADWLNKTVGVDHITGENFFDALDNGVIVCHLARVIQDKARHAVHGGYAKGPVPVIRGRCWETAARRSFFARDNMENFIHFCRKLGVHENLLFESDDLVLHGQPRNVVLCLLEVARLATRFNVEPPGLVQFEKEIAEEESQDSGLSHSSLLSWQFHASANINSRKSDKLRHSSSSSAISTSSINHWNDNCGVVLLTPEPPLPRAPLPTAITASGASDGVPSDTTEDDWSRGSGEDPDMEIDTQTFISLSIFWFQVQNATRLMQKSCHCSDGKCSKLKVRKVGEGRYNIAGRNVFIRLLKGRHMMVRVGGGWDTLEHFLSRHDPCQVRTPSRNSPDRPASAAKYLHRSPLPRERDFIMR
ncbi:growth arrest-specific protein 2-like isoform X2 [Chrysoperla carnea]|uniref:growth arrest-specific protein 2-like isoform X2 n=1 Tax=Chrysoperla carnea TaxID=189513 RepID=UPI001D08B957|nr:growth arrest-specific protein 2-like isoform X2 [Chrysoperla carnea]